MKTKIYVHIRMTRREIKVAWMILLLALKLRFKKRHKMRCAKVKISDSSKQGEEFLKPN